MHSLSASAQWACLLAIAAILSPALSQSVAPAPEAEDLPVLSTNTQCRIIPYTTYCALPLYLGNFQGNYQCAAGVKIGRPDTVEQLQELVTLFPRVKASGVGHSWWGEMFCSGSDEDSINLVLTELASTRTFIENPVDPSAWLETPPPADFPIQVNEEAGTVTVAAGISQRHLLQYLAAYTHWNQPNGWTLPAFSWFIDQTIGGAVATATHGSSLRWGSLSSQVRGMKVILANGTMYELKSPEQDLHLWKALGVNVGRLGVVTEVTLRIIPSAPVTKTATKLTYDEYVAQVEEAQEAYKAAKAAGDEDAMRAALAPLDETGTFWMVPTGYVLRADFTHEEKGPEDVVLNLDAPTVTAMNGPSQAVPEHPFAFEQTPRPELPDNEFQLDDTNAVFLADAAEAALALYMVNGTWPRHEAYLAATVQDAAFIDTGAPFDQYEAAVPFERAADCLKILGENIYGPEDLATGFRTANNIRFISGEDFYLSPSNGGPVMYINFEDYVQPSGGGDNVKFDKVARLFLDECGGRFHWGKAGWPKHLPCFDGAAAYPETWCHFGCAVQQLDPQGKFRSEADFVWNWNAERDGQPVEFASCCTPEGFSAECTCAPSPPPNCGADGQVAASADGQMAASNELP